MRKSLLFLLLLPLAMLGLTLSGCDNVGPERTGSFTVLLTDAPGDFKKAVVTIEDIYLQGDGREFLLQDASITADLLELQNEVLALVEDVAVQGGTYSQLRLVISGGYIEVEQEDGSTLIYASSPDYAAAQGVIADGHLQLPSFAQSGLKIDFPGGGVLVDGGQHIILLDFNVAQSFGHQAGASGLWVMTPVIHASDFTLTGSVEVTLELDAEAELPGDVTLADFSATLDKNGDIIAVDFEETNGVHSLTFQFLEPGSYEVDIVAPAGFDFTADRDLPFTASVTSGATTRETVILESVFGEE
jgi:hypothetical protein